MTEDQFKHLLIALGMKTAYAMHIAQDTYKRIDLGWIPPDPQLLIDCVLPLRKYSDDVRNMMEEH